MNVHAPPRMTAEQFIDWAMAKPRGRYELNGGWVVEMSPERVKHGEITTRVGGGLVLEPPGLTFQLTNLISAE